MRVLQEVDGEARADQESGESETGDIFHQGKHAGGNLPSFYLMTKRNTIAFRSPTLNLQSTVVGDFRPHLGEWMHFRVDVSWTDDSTGYYKVSTRMPGESEFTLRQTYENVQTFNPVNPADFGYLKYVVYHDDIRILDVPQG